LGHSSCRGESGRQNGRKPWFPGSPRSSKFRKYVLTSMGYPNRIRVSALRALYGMRVFVTLWKTRPMKTAAESSLSSGRSQYPFLRAHQKDSDRGTKKDLWCLVETWRFAQGAPLMVGKCPFACEVKIRPSKALHFGWWISDLITPLQFAAGEALRYIRRKIHPWCSVCRVV
jgi:hypothetical protein